MLIYVDFSEMYIKFQFGCHGLYISILKHVKKLSFGKFFTLE